MVVPRHRPLGFGPQACWSLLTATTSCIVLRQTEACVDRTTATGASQAGRAPHGSCALRKLSKAVVTPPALRALSMV